MKSHTFQDYMGDVWFGLSDRNGELSFPSYRRIQAPPMPLTLSTGRLSAPVEFGPAEEPWGEIRFFSLYTSSWTSEAFFYSSIPRCDVKKGIIVQFHQDDFSLYHWVYLIPDIEEKLAMSFQVVPTRGYFDDTGYDA